MFNFSEKTKKILHNYLITYWSYWWIVYAKWTFNKCHL